MNRQIYETVIRLYQNGIPVKECARQCGISSVKAGRILITEGLWQTKRSEEVRLLLEKGKSKEEIAAELYLSIKAVEAYMPYQRGAYLEGDPTGDSIRSRKYRKSIENIKKVTIAYNGEKEKPIMKEKTPVSTTILHIRLKRSDDDPEVDRVLRQYGGVKFGNTLSRDIVIPSDMPLYALHYCILSAFGFLNEHLHHFEMPNENMILDYCHNRFGEWKKLCGDLFRDPYIKDEDRFYMDDYRKGSFRKWQQSKYTGPYIKELPGESYTDCQNSIDEVIERFPYIAILKKDEKGDYFGLPQLVRREAVDTYRNDDRYNLIAFEDAPLDEMKYVVDGQLFDLRESLQVTDILRCWQTPVSLSAGISASDRTVASLNYEYDFGDGWEFEITRFDSVELLQCVFKGKSITARTYEQACNNCIQNHRPVCIRHEGNYLVEDAGGLYGYIMFLRSIHPEEEYHKFMEGTVSYDNNGPYDSRESSLMWAEGLEWADKNIIDRTLL